MSQEKVTLQDITGIRKGEQLCIKLSGMEGIDIINKIKDKRLGKLRWIKWPDLYNEILEKASEALDIDLLSDITQAWIKNKTFEKFDQVIQAKPGDTLLIPVAEHTICSKHEPYLEIMLNNYPALKIDFEINLSLEMKGIILKIQDKKIKEIQTGECKISGVINCEKIKIINIESDIKLPGVINLN